MDQDAIFGPVLATVLLTFLVWMYMYVRRIRFINREGLTPEQLAIPGELARVSPPEVSNPSDNLKNLFEMPVLFYALALVLFVTGEVRPADVVAGWVFVVFRAFHSLVHCTVNVVMVRFTLYLVSSLAVWFIAARAILRALGS